MQPCAAYYRSIDSPDCIASESEAELSSSWWRCVDAARSRGERKKGKKEKKKKKKERKDVGRTKGRNAWKIDRLEKRDRSFVDE